MKRLFIVYNPRSSHYEQVKTDIIDRLKGLKGVMVGKFEVEPTNVDDNARRLAKVLTTGDLVIAAGGDGTANIAVNGIMLSKAQNVKFGVIGYGNFNDVARTFGNLKLDDILRGHVKRVYPLECKINGKHWRFGMCYFTLGMFAESCAVYDEPKTRKALQKRGSRGLLFNVSTLANWWFREHKKDFLPNFALGSSSDEFIPSDGASDYMAVNGMTVAKMMKGGKWFMQDKYFLSYYGNMTKFGKLLSFMGKSIFGHIPGIETDYDCLSFAEPASLMVQAEGEYKRLEGVKKIEITKAKKPLLVVMEQ